MDIEVKDITALNVPVADLEELKPYAAQAGHAKSDSATVRWAIIELAKIKREADKDS